MFACKFPTRTLLFVTAAYLISGGMLPSAFARGVFVAAKVEGINVWVENADDVKTAECSLTQLKNLKQALSVPRTKEQVIKTGLAGFTIVAHPSKDFFETPNQPKFPAMNKDAYLNAQPVLDACQALSVERLAKAIEARAQGYYSLELYERHQRADQIRSEMESVFDAPAADGAGTAR